MAGKIIFTPEPGAYVHTCEGQPEAKAHAPGTIWQCDECFRTWVVVLEGAAPNANPSIKVWRRLTEANRDGRDY